MQQCGWGSVVGMTVEHETPELDLVRDGLPLDLRRSEETGNAELHKLCKPAIESVAVVFRASLNSLHLADAEAWVEAGIPQGGYGGELFCTCQ